MADDGFPSVVVPDNDGAASVMTSATTAGSSGPQKSGWDAFEFSRSVLAGIKRMGYKLPTPIQKATLRVALSGKDVVAMARTGSGKTAAFLLPIVQKLAAHSTIVGARALILSPTRELAQQTMKFAASLATFTDLRTCLLVGGDAIEDQFEALARNPDILIATPGRLMHLLQEVETMSLARVELVTFDECDRLFEMGFAEQIHSILKRLPEERQALLFSATLPKQLMQFARAGLRDPELIRLDVERKISENLKLGFFLTRPDEKIPLACFVLRELLPRDQQTIVFVATRHHVELLSNRFAQEGLACVPIYGTMDLIARRTNLSKFRNKKAMVLVVTDVAARGIDVPLLDNVLNFDFPATPKLFVHRVGRAARAGRSGLALSLVTNEELPFMVDLHLFMSHRVSNKDPTRPVEGYSLEEMTPADVHYGTVPREFLDPEVEQWKRDLNASSDLQMLVKVKNNAEKAYFKSRPHPSRRSIARAKDLPREGIHPLLLSLQRSRGVDLAKQQELDGFLHSLSEYRPKETVMETKGTGAGDSGQALAATMAMKVQNMRSVDAANRAREMRAAEKKEEERKRKQAEAEERAAAAAAAAAAEDGDDDVAPAAKKRRTVVESQLSAAAGRREAGHAPGGGVDSKAAASFKRRLSKAERKRMRKQGKAAAAEPEAGPAKAKASATVTAVAPAAAGAGESDEEGDNPFKDPEHFIRTERDDKASEAGLMVHGDMSGKRTFEEALMDVVGEEAIDMAKNRRMYYWDKRKKKFVFISGHELDDRKKSRSWQNRKAEEIQAAAGAGRKGLAGKGTKEALKTKDGQMYAKWRQRTHRTVEQQGAVEKQEDGGAVNVASRDQRQGAHRRAKLLVSGRGMGSRRQNVENKQFTRAKAANADVRDEVKDANKLRRERKLKAIKSAKISAARRKRGRE